MNSLPVIVRELRVEARHSMNYWLRVLGAGVMLGVTVMVGVHLEGRIAGKGSVMFGVLQPTLFSLIWLLVPIMTCDSISRERREGTLGLLFLTPLRPVDVGIAKALSGILRAFTLILAILPVIAISLLLGGVSGQDLLRAALMNLMALIGAIAAGLLASSRCREFSRAALLCLLFSAAFLILLGSIPVIHVLRQVAAGAWGGLQGMPGWFVPVFLTIGPWVVCSGVDDSWRQSPWATSPTYLELSMWQVFAAVGVLLLVLLLLNRHLRKLSVETGLTKRQLWWWQTFCTPRLFKRTFTRVNRGLLNRNPIGWLQRRTWTARITTWGWLGALVTVEAFIVTFLVTGQAGWDDLMEVQPLIAAFLGVGITFSAADSFRKERETGALELLLVTPLTVRQVIWGRLFGLWGQYLPVFLLLIGTWWYTASWQLWQDSGALRMLRYGFGLIFTSSFVFLPVIGLYQSLRRRNFITAWLNTTIFGLVIPLLTPILTLLIWQWLAIRTTGILPYYGEALLLGCLMASAAIQAVFAGRAALGASKDLTERRFALGN
jgi:ABC-type transport system involved in multi-copper enzyme maturation permease subunit